MVQILLGVSIYNATKDYRVIKILNQINKQEKRMRDLSLIHEVIHNINNGD